MNPLQHKAKIAIQIYSSYTNTTKQDDLEKATPVGTINKYGKMKMPDGSWQYVGKSKQTKEEDSKVDGQVRKHEHPDMESPVYVVTVKGEDKFIQRIAGMNPGDTAWYEVEKNERGIWNIKGGKSWSEARILGYTKEEAVKRLLKT